MKVFSLTTAAVGTEFNDALVQVCITDLQGRIVFNAYIKPRRHITDYRTHLTGITASTLNKNGRDFNEVKEEVLDIIQGNILVGYCFQYTLRPLGHKHTGHLSRDVGEYFRKKMSLKQTPDLKFLAKTYLQINMNEINSCFENAVTCMKLYSSVMVEWENEYSNDIRVVAYSDDEDDEDDDDDDEDNNYDDDEDDDDDDDGYGYYY